ncbi:hypothetical protein [Pseudalkalibacillus berkeleyi]|uniref:DUF3887 domain-containing protein n=1 Tax=Pseudalkalibacillus berkeleyi TaxID=1069813 RepID=A0ABS9GYX7_9BACL|nr:hypothetical protein [Pseudalkalibacillus berkeleyi]MCF6136585.1 hypothetical protein [Pseudalkalibacillus berkeleyi]
MKRALIILMLVALLGCSGEEVMQPDTPVKASTLMKHSMDIQNYEAFQRLFFEEAKGTISKEEFEKLGGLTAEATDYREHMLLTFSNGEMVLVEFAPKLEEKEDYQIVNVIPVPEDVKAFFNSYRK